jgi:predicted ATP-grasp superfamily ATP-dependent carboligase
VRVLVTDGEQVQTLGAVRALAKEGVHVVVGSATRTAVSFLSRHCAGRVLYPDPRDHEAAFVETVVRAARAQCIDVLLPIGYYATVLFSRYQSDLRRIANVAVADYPAMAIASDKGRTMAFAQALGVMTPRTYGSASEVDTFPVVIKATKGTGGVRYVNSKSQLRAITLEDIVVQEYIPGAGFGFYGLFNQGALRAYFMHHRIREFPVTGGASTAAEAYYDEELKDLGVRLMAGLQWHGVAMVEMKRDSRDGQYKLMEINPKFWGSLDLSAAAGVNFPYLTCRMAHDGDIEPVLDFDRQARFHWPFPHDVLHLIARPSSARQFVSDVFNPRVKTNLSLKDWVPSAYLTVTTPVEVARRLVRGRLFRPHGTPRVR